MAAKAKEAEEATATTKTRVRAKVNFRAAGRDVKKGETFEAVPFTPRVRTGEDPQPERSAAEMAQYFVDRNLAEFVD